MGFNKSAFASATLPKGLGGDRLINGNFDINQRAVTGSVVLAAGVYGHDRWKAGAGGCSYTFATSGGITTITITAGTLQQIIEGSNLITDTYVLSWGGTSQGKIGAGSFSDSGVTSAVTGGSNLTIEFNTGTLFQTKLELGDVVSDFVSKLVSEVLKNCLRYLKPIPIGRFRMSNYNSGVISFNVSDNTETRTGSPTLVNNGIEGTDYSVRTTTGTAQTGFTLSGLVGVLVNASKSGHGLTDGSLYIFTSNKMFWDDEL